MTKSMQVTLGVFLLLVILFFVNQKSQNDLTVGGTVIFSGNQEDVDISALYPPYGAPS